MSGDRHDPNLSKPHDHGGLADRDRRVRVALGERAYNIHFGRIDALLETVLQECGGDATHAVLITDSNVLPHAERVAEGLRRRLSRADVLPVASGEGSKCPSVLHGLWDRLLELPTDRKSIVAAVGGGVVGDLAGFVAATFARGIRFVQVPTTLLAQVDSSVGGKVGINLPGAKNMVGAFWQPQSVAIDVELLETLPDREFRSGLAEVVKYGVILDAEFFGYLEARADAIHRRDRSVLERVVARCCELKADVVQRDEREELGVRAVLNYGHTFCHAIEAETNYGTYLHGEAVAVGMLCASRLAELLGRIPPELTERQRRLLEAFRLPVAARGLDRERLLDAMQRDKKMAHGRLHFVLPSRVGHVELVGDVERALVRQALEDYC